MSDNPDEKRYGPWIIGMVVLSIILAAYLAHLKGAQ